MRSFANILSGLILCIVSVPYIRGIIRGTVRPARATWIIFFLLDLLVLAGMLAKGTVNGQIIVGTATTGIVMGATLGTTHAVPWEPHEKGFLAVGFAGVGLWIVTRDPLAGILVGILVVELALALTFLEVWRDPSRESALLWFLPALASVPILLTAPEISLAALIQPVVWCLNNTVMSLFILWRTTTYKRHVYATPLT